MLQLKRGVGVFRNPGLNGDRVTLPLILNAGDALSAVPCVWHASHIFHHFRFSFVDEPDTQYPIPDTRYPIPYTLYPTPYTLYPKPYTLYPIPYTLYPTPYTLHPIPYTLYPIPKNHYLQN